MIRKGSTPYESFQLPASSFEGYNTKYGYVAFLLAARSSQLKPMNIWTTTKRIARYGVVGFVRNGFVSLAAILMMTIMLFMLVNIMISNAAMTSTLQDLTNKVDVTVYFRTNASQDQVEEIEKSLQALHEVSSISFVRSEQALAVFR